MPPLAIGGILVSPNKIAPASRNCAIAKASSVAIRSAKAGEPAATVSPLTLKLFLAVYGMPSRDPSVSPWCLRLSLACASIKASGFRTGTAFRQGPLRSNLSIRSRYVVARPTLVISLRSRAARRSAIEASTTFKPRPRNLVRR